MFASENFFQESCKILGWQPVPVTDVEQSDKKLNATNKKLSAGYADYVEGESEINLVA